MNKLLLILLLLVASSITLAQRGIGTNNPSTEAVLHLASLDSTKGLIIPKVTTAKRPIAAPAINGMIVYNTTDSCVQLCDGTKWECIGKNDSSEWIDGSLVGLTSGAIYASKALANGDTVVIDTSGHIGIGMKTPLFPIDVEQGEGPVRVQAFQQVGNALTLKYPLPQEAGLLNYYINNNNWAGTGTTSGGQVWNTGRGFYFWPYSDSAFAGNNLTDTSLFVIKGVTGNIGMGTRTPSKKLDVNGETRIRLITDTTETANVLVANANGVVKKIHIDSIKGQEDADFFKVGTTSVPTDINDSIYTMGNVGIGVINPQSSLEIQGETKINTGRLIVLRQAGGDEGYGIDYSIDDILQPTRQGISIVNGANPSVSSARLLGSARQHGYGLLELQGTNSIGVTRGIGGWIEGITSDNAEYSSSRGVLVFNVRENTAGDVSRANLYSWLNNGTSVMTMDSLANLGVGTTNPLSRLHVVDNEARSIVQSIGGSGVDTWQQIIGADFNNSSSGTFITKGNKNWFVGIPKNNTNYRFGIGRDHGNLNPYFTIDTNGLTGIKTLTPTKELDVNGETRIRTITDTTATLNVLVANANGLVKKIHIDSIKGDADVDFFKVGTTSAPININDSIFTMGNVGIGTANPTEALDINGTLRVSTGTSGLIQIVDNFLSGNRVWMNKGVQVASSSDNMYIGLKDEGFNNEDAVIAWGDDNGDDFRFINTKSGGPVDGEERMRILGLNGNVGIGEENPNVKLHIKDSIDGIFNGLIIDNRKPYGVGTGTNETSRISLSLSEGGASAGSRVMGYIEGGVLSETSSLEGYLALGTRVGASTTEKMRILNNGNVGIGTTAPAKRLHVNANNDSLQFDNLSGTGTSLLIDANGKVYKGSADASVSSIRTISATSTALATDATIIVDAAGGAVTVNLPAAAALPIGKKYTIKKVDATVNAIIIDGNGAETIDGNTTATTTNPYETIIIQTNGTDWFIIN